MSVWKFGHGTGADQLPPVLGQQPAAQSISIVPATGATFPGSAAVGRSKVLLSVVNLTSAPITAAAYTQLVASSVAAINVVYVFEGSGVGMIIATGAAGFEVDQLYIPPGGSSVGYEINIPIATRISAKALTADATANFLVVTALS